MGIKNKYFAGYLLRHLMKNTSIGTTRTVDNQIKYLFVNNNLNHKYMKMKRK